MSKSVRHEIRVVGDEMAYVRCPDDLTPPVRAEGFLRFVPDGKKQLFVEVRNGEVLMWVEKKPIPIPRRR